VQRARERERQRHIFVVEPHRVQGSKDFLLACTGLKSTGLQIQTSWRGNLREVSSVPETASQKTRKSEYLKNSSTPYGTLLHKKTDTKKHEVKAPANAVRKRIQNVSSCLILKEQHIGQIIRDIDD
jgi:hypothetical protein